jgi:hypothetical protein
MAIRRTYLVKMPTTAGTSPFFDVLPEGPVGTPSAPVRLTPPNGTTPPNGWQDFPNDNGQFYEIRGRTIRFETEEGDDGFVPRARLGWIVSVMCIDGDSDGCNIPPVVILSRSFIGTPPDSAFVGITVDDPSYGPVIRLINSPDTEGALYSVNLELEEQKDEDRSHVGVG